MKVILIILERSLLHLVALYLTYLNVLAIKMDLSVLKGQYKASVIIHTYD